MNLLRLGVAIASMLLVGVSSSSHAGVFRAYLSKNGSDANPCTLAQPCRLLPAALAAVNAGGEIWMLDSANFNTSTVTISKSVTILAAPGALGSVVGNGGDAIAIDSANVEVTLRNLNVVYMSGMLGTGISVTGSGARVTVEKCEIFGFISGFGNGIVLDGDASLTVVDTTLRNNYAGITISRGTATISHVYALNNHYEGIGVTPLDDATATVHVSDTVTSGNHWGIFSYSDSPSAVIRLVATRTVATGNVQGGFETQGEFGAMTLAESTSTNNRMGVRIRAGTVQTTGTNFVVGNTTNVEGSLTGVSSQ